ncbi:MAG: T9SS type A sorting domain-containing protein [Chlorobi bacterium]|nr:T9SS type A sorting domain-containing protein [Chlorobiota bacterium]
MKKNYLLVVIFLLTASLFAQENLSVITEIDYFNATRYSGARNIARTNDGNVIVVFEPAGGFANQEIWYSVFNSAFQTWDVAQLSHSTTNSTGTPAVVADESGHVYAAWKEKRADGKRSEMFSKCTFIDAFTHEWTTPVEADNIDNNSGVCTIDVADDGSLFVMFSIWNDPAEFDANIYVSKSEDDGVTWNTDNLTSEFPTPNVLPFNYMDVNLAPGKNGKMFAAWEDKPTEVTPVYEVLFSEYTPADGWSLPEIVTPVNDGHDRRVQKYVDGCTPRDGAISVYDMGPADYVNAGKSSMIYYDNGTSEVLSATFNPYYIKPAENRYQFVTEIINFFQAKADASILVVDDDNRYNNEWVITDVLDSLGITYSVFDCGDNSGMATDVPTAAELTANDLVIWFTGDDYNDLAFWNINEEDNPELITYLNTQGKKLAVIGRSFNFDRFGGAPDDFAEGDFNYDFLGEDSYDVQSWADDSQTGVKELDLTNSNGLTAFTLDPIDWGMEGGTRQGEPSIAGDGNGLLHMVYLDEYGSHILYKTYDGSDWSDPIQLDNTADTVYVQRPNISIDPNFGVYVIWMQETDKIDGIRLYNVVYTTSPDGGAEWNEPAQLSNCTYLNDANYSIKNPTIGRKVRPAIEGVFDGGAEVVWTEASESSALGYNIMYARIPYVGTVSGVNDGENQPLQFALKPNYPNPFNPSTNLEFSIPNNEFVTLEIYNSVGERIDILASGNMNSGVYKYTWNAKNLPSGVYFARLTSGAKIATQKLLLLK